MVFVGSAATVAATAPVGSGCRRRRVAVDPVRVQAREQRRLRRRCAVAALPAEAQSVQVAIRRGGPFAYPKDGIVFANRERLLPAQPRGFYREYTVPTPGARDRGARRIVCGGPRADGAAWPATTPPITTRAFTGSRHERSRNFS